MTLTAVQKGKTRALPLDKELETVEEDEDSYSSSSSSDSESESGSTSEDSDSEEITQELLDSLLQKARESAKASCSKRQDVLEEDVIQLSKDDEKELPLPTLDPGILLSPYIELGTSKSARMSKTRDLDAEQVEKASTSRVPSALAPPPSALPKGKQLTKREKKAAKNKTTGSSWFDLPAPAEAELPKLYREVEALRLKNQLDPKRFYRKEAGEGKGIKGLPKYFAIGTIVSERTPFGTASSDNLSRAQRKRTLVDELVDDAEAKSYAKKKFRELQSVRGARGRGTLAQRQAKRKPKW